MKTRIDSRWGALGAFFTLEAYGLVCAYLFAAAVSQVVSGAALDDFAGTVLSLVVGGSFFAVFIYVQGLMLKDILAFLGASKDVRGWLHELGRAWGVVRLVLAGVAAAFYAGLFAGRWRLGFPEVNMWVLAGYQVFHPLASLLVGRCYLKGTRKTRMVYRSAGQQMAGFVGMFFAAAVFAVGGMALRRDGEPAYWLFLMIGVSLGAMAVVTLFLEDVRGREVEEPEEE